MIKTIGYVVMTSYKPVCVTREKLVFTFVKPLLFSLKSAQSIVLLLCLYFNPVFPLQL